MLEDPWRFAGEWRTKGHLIDGQNDAAKVHALSQKMYDLIIVGSGPGGSMVARQLSQAGAKVLILESGHLYTAQDFNGSDDLYLKLYKNGLLHSTADGSVNLLQGQCVGGSATINWTSSFRMPERTLDHWITNFGLNPLLKQKLAASYDFVESYANVAPWTGSANRNNQALATGAKKLGWQYDLIPRNVKGCWDLGFCGLGCPVNAKQSPLVTSIPDALKHGATLVYGAPVDRLVHDNARIYGVTLATGSRLYARHVALAAGAINSPGILLRSGLQQNLPRIGQSTSLHPSCFSLAQFNTPIDSYYGAPQSIYSDQFLWPDENDKSNLGFKIEAVPLPPVLAAGIFARGTQAVQQDMQTLNHTQGMLALIRDGFGADTGGSVFLDDFNDAKLDYPITDLLTLATRRALYQMAKCQFAAGAARVRPSHLAAEQWFETLDDLEIFLMQATFDKYELSLGSAHIMGGCGFGRSAQDGVVDTNGAVFDVSCLSVVDACVFPTSLGVNPQLTIMALANLFAEDIQKKLKVAT